MNETSDTKHIRLTLILYLVIFGMKLVVYYMSGTLSMLAEAFHTLSDIFISGFLLVAMYFARKKPDEKHMFGYARAQNVAALVAATLFISFTSFKLFEDAIPRLFQTEEVHYENLTWVLVTLVVSIVIAAVPLIKILRNKERGAVAKAQMMELINDELGLLAALLGTLGIMMGYPIADPLAAIAVATIIAINAFGLFRENLTFLIGRSPGSEFLTETKALALSVPGVLGVHDLRVEYVGPQALHADIHIVVEPELPLHEAHEIVNEVLLRLHDEVDLEDCTIHLDSSPID